MLLSYIKQHDQSYPLGLFHILSIFQCIGLYFLQFVHIAKSLVQEIILFSLHDSQDLPVFQLICVFRTQRSRLIVCVVC